MKIFEFKYSTGEKDWVFAKDKEDAIEFYMKHNGLSEFDLPDEIIDIHESEWKNRYVYDINEQEPDETNLDYKADYPEGHNEDDYINGYKILYSFAEYAKENVFPDIIATTEY